MLLLCLVNGGLGGAIQRLTHDNLSATCTSLEEAWGWTRNDRILHVLPLHHNHGLINKLCCPLWVGASTELLDAWSPASVWAAFLREPDAEDALTVFMATPTIYAKLYEHYQSVISKTMNIEEVRRRCSSQRVMVSGSSEFYTCSRSIAGSALSSE